MNNEKQLNRARVVKPLFCASVQAEEKWLTRVCAIQPCLDNHDNQ